MKKYLLGMRLVMNNQTCKLIKLKFIITKAFDCHRKLLGNSYIFPSFCQPKGKGYYI